MSTLILICGMVGSGKTSLAKELEQSHQVFRFCPDEWIKALIKDQSDKLELDRLRDPVEQLQWHVARKLLGMGVSIILENGFWSGEERRKLCLEGKALGARVELYYLDVPKPELWRRLEKRNAKPEGTSFQVTREELDLWWSWFNPPNDDEAAIYDDFKRIDLADKV